MTRRMRLPVSQICNLIVFPSSSIVRIFWTNRIATDRQRGMRRNELVLELDAKKAPRVSSISTFEVLLNSGRNWQNFVQNTYKVNANRRDVALGVCVICKSQEQTWLADACSMKGDNREGEKDKYVSKSCQNERAWYSRLEDAEEFNLQKALYKIWHKGHFHVPESPINKFLYK